MEKITKSGVRIVQAGSKDNEPILLLHAAGQLPEGFEPQIELLATKRRIIAPNIYDLAENISARGDQLTFSKLADEIESLNIVPDSQFEVLGYSLGGGVSIALAAQNRNVKRLVLASSVGEPQQKNWRNWIKDFLIMKANAKKMRLKRTPEQMKSDRQFVLYVARNSKNVARVFNLAANADLRDLMAKLNIEVEIVWGQADTFVSYQKAEEMKDRFPNAHLHALSTHDHNWYNHEPNLVPNIVLNGCSER